MRLSGTSIGWINTMWFLLMLAKSVRNSSFPLADVVGLDVGQGDEGLGLARGHDVGEPGAGEDEDVGLYPLVSREYLDSQSLLGRMHAMILPLSPTPPT